MLLSFLVPVVIGVAWLVIQLTGYAKRAPPVVIRGSDTTMLRPQGSIRIIDVIPDEKRRTLVWALYEGDTAWKEFRRFSPSDNLVKGCACVDVNGDQLFDRVVVGLKCVDEGSSLFVFNHTGETIHKDNLSPPPQLVADWKAYWTDWRGDPNNWGCAALAVGNVDDTPGDEVIVSTIDPDEEYLSTILLIDPEDFEVRSRFWHLGHVNRLKIVNDFFGEGKPGIVAYGAANKLDCFSDGLKTGETQLAHWDYVSMLMILDPERMDTLGVKPKDVILCPH